MEKIYIGKFNEEELRNNKDKKEIKKVQEKNAGYDYIDSQLIKKGDKIVGINVWICNKYRSI